MSQTIHSEFNALSIEGIRLLNILLKYLADELNALSERDIEKIKLSTFKKTQILSEFSSNTELRNKLLKSKDLEPSKESIIAFFASCTDQPLLSECQNNWNELEITLKDVIKANTVNEQVVKKNKSNITSILSILQGKTKNNMLYDAKGDKGDYSGQSRLGKA
ncbi:flagellar protein FlgN [Gammaproteobacteria bacterium AS21]